MQGQDQVPPPLVNGNLVHMRGRTDFLPSCRDGLREHPPATKRAISGQHSSKSKASSLGRKQKEGKTLVEKVDRRIEELESLHRRTGTASSIHRLKLDSSRQLKLKYKPILDSSFKFTDLSDPQRSTAVFEDTIDLDDEEIPEAYDILNTTLRSPPSDTNYSNSEVDSLIRAVPSNQTFGMMKTSISPRCDQEDHAVSRPSRPPIQLKHGRDAGKQNSPPKKRIRYEYQDDDGEFRLLSPPVSASLICSRL